ncbi:Glycoside hydrolase, family 16 [Cordyceps militaris CM01]|uniref:Glycoside hydrolase, family 16 n=2 Tax=Cordyceps militaris TaxID=73501 RepID=G3JPH8_CORMM|nr:Glycoside hydrolase, family 16 [Cordyceps militaris CM01]ATY61824.1 Glycoside family 16 [Cordyceps militaris]EGX89788.1 Glycoside hydrolase, family 16 [Cordyceps militaris CM01]
MLRSVVAALLSASTALALCSPENPCPQSSPCCSQYGECGVGAYCLGGCDPRASFKLEACAPAPVCSDKKMTFDKIDKTSVDISKYYGDASKADWMVQGEVVQYNDYALMTMAKDTPGTVLASTEYMWYGNVKATMKTSRGRGVVTAFILLSDVKDEIDYEWVGVDLGMSQTNYYYQGITNYGNSGNITTDDTFGSWHEYEIRWTPDKVEWLVDGTTHRTKERKDTWNKTANAWAFPQTPARIQLSIWPGGKASNPPGTINWAGGVISWDTPDVKNNGYYYAAVKSVEVKCYSAKSAPGTNSGKSYVYTDARATNDTVKDTDKSTIIGSFSATGLDMDAGKTDTNKPTPSQASVPGGGIPGKNDHGDDKPSGGSAAPVTPPAQGLDPKTCDPKTFNQDCSTPDADGTSKNAGKNSGSQLQASMLAIVIAGAALFCL